MTELAVTKVQLQKYHTFISSKKIKRREAALRQSWVSRREQYGSSHAIQTSILFVSLEAGCPRVSVLENLTADTLER